MRCCLLLAACLFLAGPVGAIDPDKYLPGDTDAVVAINVQQILASPLVKTHYLQPVQDWLKSSEETPRHLKSLGLDPLKDIDQVVFANGEGLYRLTKGVEKGKTVYGSEGGYFFLVKGRFNVARIRTYADQLAKEKESIIVKTHKAGGGTIYELDFSRLGGKDPKKDDKKEPAKVAPIILFAAVVDGTTIAASSRMEPVVEALDKAAGKRKPGLKHKEMTAALAKLDGKQSVGIAVPGIAGFSLDAEITKLGGKIVERPVKFMLQEDGIDGIAGSIQVTDGITGGVVVTVRGAAVAKDVAKSLQQDLSDGIDLILRALFKYPKLGPVAEFVKSITVSVKDNKTVQIQGNVTAQQAAESLK
jgi:hypothetical protein